MHKAKCTFWGIGQIGHELSCGQTFVECRNCFTLLYVQNVGPQKLIKTYLRYIRFVLHMSYVMCLVKLDEDQ